MPAGNCIIASLSAAHIEDARRVWSQVHKIQLATNRPVSLEKVGRDVPVYVFPEGDDDGNTPDLCVCFWGLLDSVGENEVALLRPQSALDGDSPSRAYYTLREVGEPEVPIRLGQFNNLSGKPRTTTPRWPMPALSQF